MQVVPGPALARDLDLMSRAFYHSTSAARALHPRQRVPERSLVQPEPPLQALPYASPSHEPDSAPVMPLPPSPRGVPYPPGLS